MYQRTRVVALCAGAVVAIGLPGCGAADTTAGAAGTSAGSTADADGSSAPATTPAVAEYGVPTTVAPDTDPTEMATDSPVVPGPEAPGDAATGADVTVLITYADWDDASASVQAAAAVSGVIEDGGTCTLELSSGPDAASASGTGVADAASTSCGGLQVARADLGSGTWQAVVRYSSATSSGTSDPTEVVVP